MVKMNTASPEMLAYLWFVVQNNANILITGGVSTGKTSFLNCLSLFIPPEAKVVSIEDTRELSLPHENWIPGVVRVGFTGTGVGEVTMFELLRESFRQNPDYLIVGEIRGKEAYVMFQAMASGHPSMSTMHAGNIDDVIKRLQTHPINLSAGLLEVLDIVIVMVHAREKGKSARRVKEVVELQSIDVDSGRVRATKSFVWLPAIDSHEYRGDSWVLHKLSKEKGIPMDKIIKEISQRKKLINWMVENNVIALNDVVKYVNLYYRKPEKLKEIIGTSE
jgi:flagellar protein FlaI